MDWNKIKVEYITEKTSYRKLAKKYGVSFSTLQARARNENWPQLKKQHNDNIVTKSVENVENEAVSYRTELYELAYKVAQQMMKLTTDNDLEELIRLGVKPRDITGAIKDLEDVLHIKSDIDLKEQETRIEKLRKDVESGDNQPNEIKITIAGGEKEWAQ